MLYKARVSCAVQRAVLILALGLGTMCGVIGCGSDGHSSGVPSEKEARFAREKWRSGNAKVRGAMVCDLVDHKNEILMRKSQIEIEGLLGKPSATANKAWSYEVDLGQDYLGAPWMYQLKISFDGQGEVCEVMLLD